MRDDGTAEGVITGTCDTSVGQCMLQTWCPLENEPSNTSTGLKGTEDFTIFIRNNVNFADFGIHRSNIEENSLQMGYNLFSVRQIINMAGFTYDEIQDHGASIAMTADWKCDFDQADSKCRPTFSAERLDNAKSHFSSGFNFRDATYYIDGSRDIHKRYGLKLTFRTSGDGRKFSIVPLLTALGAGVGLLAIATVVCDFIATKIGNDKDFYLHEKFRVITSEEVEAHMFNSDSNESASNHSSRRTSTTGDSEETLGGHPYIHIDTEAEHIQQPSSSPSAAGDYNPPTVV